MMFAKALSFLKLGAPREVADAKHVKPRILDTNTRLSIYYAISKQLQQKQPLREILDNMQQVLTRRDRVNGKTIRNREAKKLQPTALREWSRGLASGKGLGESMRGWVPASERMLVIAGERSEKLSEMFVQLVDVVKQRQKILGSLAKGVTYPALLMFLACGVLWMFGVKIIPAIEASLPADRWQGLSYGLLVASKFVRTAWPFALGVMVALIVWFVWSLNNWTSKMRTRLDRYPPYSLYRLSEGTSFLFAMHALIGTGTPLIAALRLVSESATPWMKQRVQTAATQVSKGRALGDALDSTGYEFPDQQVVDSILVLAKNPNLDEILKQIAENWSQHVTEKIEREAFWLFIIGVLIVGGLTALCFLALFSLMGSIADPSSLG